MTPPSSPTRWRAPSRPRHLKTRRPAAGDSRRTSAVTRPDGGSGTSCKARAISVMLSLPSSRHAYPYRGAERIGSLTEPGLRKPVILLGCALASPCSCRRAAIGATICSRPPRASASTCSSPRTGATCWPRSGRRARSRWTSPTLTARPGPSPRPCARANPRPSSAPTIRPPSSPPARPACSGCRTTRPRRSRQRATSASPGNACAKPACRCRASRSCRWAARSRRACLFPAW